ncbi:MAG TPA: DNA polymerase ligase N-terminal domain-containing protein [Solirubrobacteraceae bacterium]
MPRFVVQQHAATTLHFDLRLEVDGVLRSWAVPKGPSLDPSDKRLAVEVEDHSLAYGNHEGERVIIWDRGTYENRSDVPMAEALDAGHAVFHLDGEKLRGAWVLQRWAGKRKPTWLLVKRRDEDADPERDLVAELPHSVVSGRTLGG